MTQPNFSVPRRTPFRRAIMKTNELNWIHSRPAGERDILLLKVKPYKGRGKNHNYPFTGPQIESRAGDRSKYSPHQGVREIRRRFNRTPVVTLLP